MKFSRRIQCNIVDSIPKGHPCRLRFVILNHLILFDWLLFLQKCPSYKIKQAEAGFQVWRSYRGIIIPVVEVICTELIVTLLGGNDRCMCYLGWWIFHLQSSYISSRCRIGLAPCPSGENYWNRVLGEPLAALKTAVKPLLQGAVAYTMNGKLRFWRFVVYLTVVVTAVTVKYLLTSKAPTKATNLPHHFMICNE